MSEGYEEKDAALFASWGADMLKVDACGTTESAETLVSRWSSVLNATGRPILFSDCHNGCETGSWKPYCADKANMWRSSRDIQPTWKDVMFNLDTLKGRGSFGAPGRWNDPDFLELDNGEFAWDGSERIRDMNEAHFGLWAITSAPLIAGNDIRSMPKPVRLYPITAYSYVYLCICTVDSRDFDQFRSNSDKPRVCRKCGGSASRDKRDRTGYAGEAHAGCFRVCCGKCGAAVAAGRGEDGHTVSGECAAGDVL